MERTMNTLELNVDVRQKSLLRDLGDLRRELAEVGRSLDRYEKAIEVPRLLHELRHIEFELQQIEER